MTGSGEEESPDLEIEVDWDVPSDEDLVEDEATIEAADGEPPASSEENATPPDPEEESPAVPALPTRGFGGVFGRWIKARRESTRCTQREIAALVGVSSGELSQIENGIRLPKEAVRDRLLEVFGNTDILHAAGTEFWKEDDRSLRRAEARGIKRRRRGTRAEQLDAGRIARTRILRLLADDVHTRAYPASTAALAQRLGLTAVTVAHHVHRLASERLVRTQRQSFGSQQVLITLDGYEQAVRQGERSGEWLPPIEQTDPVVLEAARLWFQRRRWLQEPPEPPPPAPIQLPPKPPPRPPTLDTTRVQVLRWLGERPEPQTKEDIGLGLGLSTMVVSAAVEALIDEDLVWWKPGGKVIVTEDFGRAWLSENPP